jgi:hypothetical protein
MDKTGRLKQPMLTPLMIWKIDVWRLRKEQPKRRSAAEKL